ncbi:hypothetical protein B0T14DRAFT_43187 [Immersiella caudata]|uniref:Uncharacterized protein n=1 Tax=Immersiella caudata TaxID=314043 RepID=A0AA40CBY9_9PEZI|nr:hypothetical protein B0T14DRAFT_43187 [Immersiella caudata]
MPWRKPLRACGLSLFRQGWMFDQHGFLDPKNGKHARAACQSAIRGAAPCLPSRALKHPSPATCPPVGPLGPPQRDQRQLKHTPLACFSVSYGDHRL